MHYKEEHFSVDEVNEKSPFILLSSVEGLAKINYGYISI